MTARGGVPVVVVGGAGFVGSAVARRAVDCGRPVTTLDRSSAAGSRLPAAVVQHGVDLLTDPVELPDGCLVLAFGTSDARTRSPWRLVLEHAVTTARLLPALVGRQVVLVSSVEVHGPAGVGLPWPDSAIEAWTEELLPLAGRPCPPWQVAGVCRELAAADPTGRWVYALAKRAQELMVRSAVDPDRLTVLRSANLFGPGQDRAVAQLSRRALAGLPLTVTDTVRTFVPLSDLAAVALEPGGPGAVDAGLAALALPELASVVLEVLGLDIPVRVVPAPPGEPDGRLDTRDFQRRLGCAMPGPLRLREELRAFVSQLPADRLPAFHPALPVVVPPRPRRPDEVAVRTQACLETGALKDGRWAAALTEGLRHRLEVPADTEVLVTGSGSAALRLAVQAIAGPVTPGDVAVLPSFTFVATGEVLAQLGYRLRFCDVQQETWTMDPLSLAAALAPGDARVVVAVDALGAPADYTALNKVCADAGVPLVADSAAALGAAQRDRPIGTQAVAHAFSLSFAKVLSAGGGGGAVVLPGGALERLRRPVDWTRSVPLMETAAVAALDLLQDLDLLVAARREVAVRYAELAGRGAVPQQAARGDAHAWVHWAARFPGVDRGTFAADLQRLGIGTKPYYAPALHHQDWGPHAEVGAKLPVTDRLAREVLALPMSSELSSQQADRVVTAVLGALASARR